MEGSAEHGRQALRGCSATQRGVCYGVWLAEPDLSYEEVRLALEYNGANHAGRARMRREITRELDMRRRGGWETLVFGPAEVFGRPDQIGLTVREVRRERGARFQ